MTMPLLGTLLLLALCNSIQFSIGNAAFEAGRVEADSSNSSDERAGEIQRTAPGLPALELPRPLASASIPWVMAYRGASTAWPEHSIGAYKEAIEQGMLAPSRVCRRRMQQRAPDGRQHVV